MNIMSSCPDLGWDVSEVARLMEEHERNVSAVARTMGKDRTQIRRWLRRFGLG